MAFENGHPGTPGECGRESGLCQIASLDRLEEFRVISRQPSYHHPVNILNIIYSLAENASLIFVLVVVYGFAWNSFIARYLDFAMGTLLGLAALIAMQLPVHLADGVSIDARTILVAIAGYYFGWRGGLAAFALAAIYRFTLGGIGMSAGIVALGSVATLGAVWQRQRWCATMAYGSLLLFGCAVAILSLVSGLLFLPREVAWSIISGVCLPVMVVYPLGVLLYGKLLGSEHVRQQTQTSLRESEARYRTAFLTSPDSINITRLCDGLFLEVNDGFIRLMGWTRVECLGRTTLEMGIWRNAQDRQRLVDALQRDGYCNNLEAEFVAKGGHVITCLMSAHTMELNGQTCILSVTRDITERKAVEDQLRKLSQAVEQSSDSIVITDVDARIEYVNEAFVRNTGFSREEALGKNPRILQSGKTPGETYVAMWQALVEGRAWSGEFFNQRKDGTGYIEAVVLSPIRQPDGCITHYVGAMTDITAKKEADERINSLAFFDPLTELPNRRLLLDRLKHAIATSVRTESYCALLFIDLDNFKTLNDTLGHDIGDLLLQQTARRLAECVREGDTVARLGGDEFVLLLESLSDNAQEAARGAEAVGAKILAALNQPYQLAGFTNHSSPSIGVTLFADHQGSLEDLLKRADLAMYQAKDAGRNTLRFFEPEMQAAVTTRAALESDLRKAVRDGEFVLHYQVQVDRAGAMTGVEALVRWQHQQRGLVSPMRFIPLAESTGLILPIGRWVLETACAQLRAWSGHPTLNALRIAVNVSARQFYQPDFVEQVVAIMEQTGANPTQLKLELTESLLVSNIEDVITKMHRLKALGVGFSLDDFGTGYSSLSYLKRLPLDQLKIDQSFVKDILTDPNDAAIAKMVIALAGSLGLDVIAEGVETVPQREFLAEQGCHVYQGYLFSRPIPIEEFEEFAARV
jgi:diguanylate cyclase (GGDEF)-like protein/PAS domain S-box-containing protein